MTLSVRHLGTRFGDGKMALETTRLNGFSINSMENMWRGALWPRLLARKSLPREPISPLTARLKPMAGTALAKRSRSSEFFYIPLFS